MNISLLQNIERRFKRDMPRSHLFLYVIGPSDTAFANLRMYLSQSRFDQGIGYPKNYRFASIVCYRKPYVLCGFPRVGRLLTAS